jgi:hypothetical protein
MSKTEEPSREQRVQKLLAELQRARTPEDRVRLSSALLEEVRQSPSAKPVETEKEKAPA